MATGIQQRMKNATQEQYEAQARQAVSSMVTSPVNIERELKVDLSSDRATVAEAMGELLATDIRPELPKITTPVLVLGSWIAYQNYGATHDGTLSSYQNQLAGVHNAKVVLSDTSKHFIQLDAPDWFYGQVDAFLR